MFLQKDFIPVKPLKFWQTDPSSVVWDTVRRTKKANCVDSVTSGNKHCHNNLQSDPNFSTSTLHWWRNIIYSLKEGDIKYIFQLLWKSGWEKEGIGMIFLNWDLPLEIPPVKSKSQVVSRPVQDLSCKWHEFAYTLFPSTSLHPFPISPLLEQASKQQEQVTLSAPGDPVRLTIHKVLQSAQSKPAEQTKPRRRSALLSNLWGCMKQQQIYWQARVPSNSSAVPSPAPQLRCGAPAFTRW